VWIPEPESSAVTAQIQRTSWRINLCLVIKGMLYTFSTELYLWDSKATNLWDSKATNLLLASNRYTTILFSSLALPTPSEQHKNCITATSLSHLKLN